MAEIMPFVMVPRSCTPRGSPMATTLSPTRSFEESPNSAAWSPRASILRTARSLISSLPTSAASNSRLSFVRTEMTSAPLMTWWFVMT